MTKDESLIARREKRERESRRKTKWNHGNNLVFFSRHRELQFKYHSKGERDVTFLLKLNIHSDVYQMNFESVNTRMSKHWSVNFSSDQISVRVGRLNNEIEKFDWIFLEKIF